MKLIAFCFTLLSAAWGCVAHAQPLVVKIGHAAPLSGRAAADGISSERAARLAIEDIHQRGLLINGRPLRLELVSLDDGAYSEQAIVVARQLVAQGVVAVVGHLASGTSAKAAPVYAQAGVVQVSPFATNPSLGDLGHKTFFRTITSDAQAMQVLGSYAVRELKLRRVSVLDAEVGAGPTSVELAFSKAFEQAGGQVVAREEIKTQPDDLQPLLTRLTAGQPDAIFLSGFDGFGARLLRQMQAMKIPTALLGSRTLCTNVLPFLAQGSEKTRQVLCALGGNLSPEGGERYTAFAKAYTQRWGQRPEESAAHAYDAVLALVQAMLSAQSIDPKRFAAAMATVQLDTAVSGQIAFDERGDLRAGDVTLLSYGDRGRQVRAVIRSALR